MDNRKVIIELQNIKRNFQVGDETVHALRGVSFTIHEGEFVTIMGTSGSGKSTLLNTLGCLDTPTSGEYLLDGVSVRTMGQRAILRNRKIGFVFQNYNLLPKTTAVENVELPLMYNSSVSAAERRRRAIESLIAVGLGDRLEHKSNQMSGGQMQRVAIARAIVNEPEVLLLDEPLAALDLKMRKDMQMELKEMHKTLGITFIYVTHDQEEALTLSDTIVVMSEGKIQQIGTPVDIYNEPINSFVADFIGESNILNGTMIQDKLVRFAGVEFECVDEGFGENMPVDVVVRPEDWYIFPDSDASQISGIVTSSIFKGVHYEMVVEANGYEFIVQDYHHFAVGEQVGLLIKPFDIHIMKKERVCNTFEGELTDGTHVEFLGCTFECLPVVDIEPGTKVKVQVDFKDIILQDNEEDGTLTGDVRFILYKGDHYHLTVSSDWGEDIFVDTNDVWDNGDHVGISIFPESIKITQIVES
jgi:spermidine/putrescine transport system ATP-binding protein